jgi:phage protein D
VTDKFLSQFFVKISGSDVPAELMKDVIEIVVDSSLYLPEMFTLQLRDPELKWVDDAMFELGEPVEISAQASEQQGGKKGLLMKGEIAALEPHFEADGSTTVLIRGYNKSHRLHRGKKTRTFLKQSDSDIVKTIAGEVGLSPQVDSTGVVYDYVIQNNQTNMEFLQTRAERLGYKVFAANGTLYFKKGETSLGEGPELEHGRNLRSFRPSVAATHQADKIKVLGWDAKQKQAIKSEVTPPAALKQGGIGQTGGDAAKSAFGTADAVLVNQPVFTPDEATALATGLANDLSGEFIQAEGTCFGDPDVKAGHTIRISNVGTRFSGKYFVTSATHIWNQAGYETHFSISGRQPNTVSHLLESGNGRTMSWGLVQGVATGLVTNLNDPDELGRVKVKYDWLGDNIESDWIRVASLMGGPDRGLLYLPEINDEVLIAFDHGSIHHPYIIGALWNSRDKPPRKSSEAVVGGKVNLRVIKSRKGHEIILDDTDSEEKIHIQSMSGHVITLDDKSGSEQIVIRDKTNKNEVIIDSVKNSMTINVAQDYAVNAKGKADHTITGNVTIDSKGNVEVKSMGNITIQSMGNLALKSTGNMDLQATGMLSVKSSAIVQIQGSLVKIN